MDNLKKNLADLKKNREDLQIMLNSLYKDFGGAQFDYASQNQAHIPSIAEQDVESWKALRDTRRQDADTILSIKTIQSRQSELKVFSGEVDKLFRERQCEYEKVRHTFLLLFFQTYRHDQAPCIAQIVQAVEPLQKAMENVQNEREELERQKNDAHFFKQLAIGPQLMTLKGKLNALQKKMEKSIIAASDSVLTDNVVSDVRGSSFPEPLETAYAELLSIAAKRNEMDERKGTLRDEQKKLQDTLAEYGAGGSPQKRITALTSQIKKTDNAIDSAEIRQGTVYADLFYTSDGKSRGEPLTDVPELFKPYLDSILDYRIQLKKNECNIEYIENEITLAGEERKIESLRAAIGGYKDGIEQYKKLIEAAEQDILRSQELKARFEKRNSELRQT